MMVLFFFFFFFFFIETGLELVGVAGPVHWVVQYVTYTKRVVRRGVCRPPLRWLSQFLSYENERDQLMMVM